MLTNDRRIHWNATDPATPALIDPMLDDIGVAENGNLESIVARDATREYCLLVLKDINLHCEGDMIMMGEMEEVAGNYSEGYLAGLHKGLASRLC